MSILKIVIVIVIENLIIIIFLCRTMFHELRLSLEHFAYSPKCPSFLKGIIYKVNTEMLKRCPSNKRNVFKISNVSRPRRIRTELISISPYYVSILLP
jgi:hypothetical protein